MTYLDYKRENEAELLQLWADTVNPGDYEMFCFQSYKKWMKGE